MKTKNKIAILVPAHNEVVVLDANLRSLLKVIDKKHVYLVSDGSKDYTAAIARKHLAKSHVLELKRNAGKANALNKAIKHLRLCQRYDYIMPLDADTRITKRFIQKAINTLEDDNKQSIAAVVGKVAGKQRNWITTYRVWEYEITQSIHKQAQDVISAIAVCPGCSTVYRSRVFEKTTFPDTTMTEDMDLTYDIHRKNIGKIVYDGSIEVTTQDPGSLRDFLKQIERWYTGFWQCVTKHNIPWGGQRLDLEVALLASEGLYNSLLVLAAALLGPILLLINPKLILIPLAFDFALFMLPTLLYVAWKRSSLKVLTYIIPFYSLRALSSLVFFKSFLRVTFGIDIKMGWLSARRYKFIERRRLWPNLFPG